MNDPLSVLRELAKTDYYQSLYSYAKELGFRVFENQTDLTYIQLWFLSYLSLYSVIQMDIAMGDVPEKVLENNIYEDAYLYFKKKDGKQTTKKNKQQIKDAQYKNSRNQNEVTTAPKSTWVFKRAKD